MTLHIKKYLVKDLIFATTTKLKSYTLCVDKKAMAASLLNGEKRIKSLNLAIAKPGDPTRIIAVKDVIEPRCKFGDNTPGEGDLHALKGMAVITCGQIVGFQEGIIDMSGPGAAYSPFADTLNLVINVEVVEGLAPHQHEEVLRNTGLKAAKLLAAVTKKLKADDICSYPHDSPTISAELPKIAYVYMLLSQGLLHDTYLFGKNVNQELPRTIPLPMLMDEAIISGNCVSACDKNTTYHHQNNPVIKELCRRHGEDLNFIGTVLTNLPVRLADKQQSAKKTIELVRALKADGALISKEGFGNPDADQMMIIRGLESSGIKTCAILDEYPGPDGSSQSLADTTPEADAVVSVGNANERITLPAMTNLIGPIQDLTKLAGAYPQSIKPDGSLEIELQGIIGATNELGFQNLSCREV